MAQNIYIHHQKQIDDVFDTAFLHGIIFTGSKEPEGPVATELNELLESWGTAWSKHMVEKLPKEPSPGLYVWKNSALWSVYRIYDDFNGAFMASHVAVPRRGTCIAVKFSGSPIADEPLK
jgi:hypothetical protein